MKNSEKSLISLCIENANKALRNRLEIKPVDNTLSGIKIVYGFNSYYFNTQAIKNISSNIQILRLSNKLNNQDTIIFINQISPPLHEYMVENRLNYIDLAGNMFIDRDSILINIHGKKLMNGASLQDKNTLVFYSSSLKIIFHLLHNKEFCQNNYRYISAVTEVSLGTITKTINKLQSIEILNNDKALIQPKELLGLWIENYAKNMRSKLIIGKYSFTKNFDKVEIMKKLGDLSQSFIGNEMSAEILDNYFQSKVLSIYAKENISEIIKRLYLKPDPKGEIEILELFWNIDEIKKTNLKQASHYNDKLVPLLLIYTDLINSNNSRAISEAKRLGEKYDIL